MRGVKNSTSHLIAQYSQLLTNQGDRIFIPFLFEDAPRGRTPNCAVGAIHVDHRCPYKNKAQAHILVSAYNLTLSMQVKKNADDVE
jgi:hypothetical protein